MAEETKLITISMESIESDVMKQVSVIAKRQKDKAGDSLFGNTTLSAVEKVVIRQYIESAVRSFAGELAPVVKTYIDSSLPASVTFNVIRLNEGHKNAFESCFRGYVRAYTTYMVLTLSGTEQAKVYSDEANMLLKDAIKLVFDKDAPSAGAKTLKDMTGSIESDPQLETDDIAIKMSFNEAAGDEAVHENTLTHDFQSALEITKVILADYLAPNAQTSGDNVIYYNDKDDDIVEFVIVVSRRCNGTLSDTLARLVAKYVEDYMMYQWWLKTTNLKQAEPYLQSLTFDEQNIRRCFVLSGPSVPTIPYTKTLTAKVDGSDNEGGVTIELGNKETTLSYSIDDSAIDDIEARSSDPSILEVQRSAEPHAFCLVPINTGVTTVTIFSRHSDNLKREVEITVTKEE